MKSEYVKGQVRSEVREGSDEVGFRERSGEVGCMGGVRVMQGSVRSCTGGVDEVGIREG